jgi:hypothetical protein
MSSLRLSTFLFIYTLSVTLSYHCLKPPSYLIPLLASLGISSMFVRGGGNGQTSFVIVFSEHLSTIYIPNYTVLSSMKVIYNNLMPTENVIPLETKLSLIRELVNSRNKRLNATLSPGSHEACSGTNGMGSSLKFCQAKKWLLKD